MIDWNLLIERVGLPSVIVVAMGWFIWKIGWPFVVDQFKQTRADKEQSRLDRIEERDLYLSSLVNVTKTHAESMAILAKSMDALTKAVNRRKT